MHHATRFDRKTASYHPISWEVVTRWSKEYRRTIYILESTYLHTEATGNMTNIEGMNRAESGLYRMQERILASARWAKMLQKVDFGKEITPYKLVPIELNGRLKQYLAQASSDKIEFSKDYVKRATSKQLTSTMKHEMAHVILLQNGISDGHSPLYKTCCFVLGLHRPDHMEGAYNYKHVCSVCGWWQKSMKRHEKIGHTCGRNFRYLVSKTEYGKLARIAKVGSSIVPININLYQVMEVQKIDQNLKLKSVEVQPEEKGEK